MDLAVVVLVPRLSMESADVPMTLSSIPLELFVTTESIQLLTKLNSLVKLMKRMPFLTCSDIISDWITQKDLVLIVIRLAIQ